MMMPENPEDLWMSEEQRERIGRRMRDIAAERAARMKIADNELGQIEECTEQILASAGAIAKINRDDPDEVHSILGRAMGALEVVTLWLMHEEDIAKHPEQQWQPPPS
jgi:hypothetical protein